MSVTMLSTSLRAPIRAVTSSAARGRTVPVTAGTMVWTVLLRVETTLMREVWTWGTMEVVASLVTTVANSQVRGCKKVGGRDTN
jgi:hypothetical protein